MANNELLASGYVVETVAKPGEDTSIRLILKSGSRRPICFEWNEHGHNPVTIREKKSNFEVIDGFEASEQFARSQVNRDTISSANKVLKIAPGGTLELNSAVSIPKETKLVSETGITIRRTISGEKVTATMEIAIFDCAFSRQNDAVDAGMFSMIQIGPSQVYSLR